ncbi:hypothetical protein [Hymenobacter cellulosilyticus]|uniref:Antitoxin VbhA domain-containing protein n=1 Tax=Hymenobacter cellulosilyticus TaxID=2932248 RepID=A0A8T9Q9A8_9BACT|nr:hypothetical protein [Hymenobacter cellulosilyticus]UOQ74117.1 hypothetical protein MUN79_09615 [Hymenobacter cellulosilyticus]
MAKRIDALSFGPGMMHDSRFGPTAQTAAQRAFVLHMMQTVMPRLKTNATPAAQQLYARYVAGELSWLEMRQRLNPGT